MNDDYLWDKSGQPDSEIQRLEEILGTLRYQPKPLELPRNLGASRRRNYIPWVAIAATVVLALIAGIIWLRVRTEKVPQQHQAVVPVLPPPPGKEQPKKNLVVDNAPVPREKRVRINRRSRDKSLLAASKKREREEALAAKEQVMLALRLASEKLNLAHRKIQSTPPANQIKNQHRIG